MRHRCVIIFILMACIAGCGAGTNVGLPGSAGDGSGNGSGGRATSSPGAAGGGSGGSSPTMSPSAPATAGAQATLPPPSTPPNAAGYANAVPTQPANGKSRPGQIYSIYVTVPKTGDTKAFTVFEPATVTGGQTYPLVLFGPGFGATRPTTLGTPAPSATAGAGAGSDLAQFVDNGYGVIAFDQRGFGQSTGDITVMDPDFDGPDLLAILDWAQNKLPWLAFGPTLEGDDPHEPVVGTIGTSYGGMYQYLLLNIDKRHRLHAISAGAAPYDLNFALYPGTVPKSYWVSLLFGIGEADEGSQQHLNLEPFVAQSFTEDLAAGYEDSYATDFFGYHSADYFYDGKTIATNGGPGTAPLTPPTSSVPKINALLGIGVRDTLFNFNNGYHNALGMATGAGDVRLVSFQAGHNSLDGAPPDPGMDLYYGVNDNEDDRCGNGPSYDSEQLAWMNQYLKGIGNAAASISKQPCISLSAGDGVVSPTVSTSTSGSSQTSFTIGSVTVTSGTSVDVPTVAQMYTASTMTVYAGVPHVHLTVSPALGTNVGIPVVFVGLGQQHASNPATWDLIDNQILPIRGTGVFDLDLIGGGARLQPGDKLALLVYGLHDQFVADGSLHAASPTVEPLTITGTVSVPFLGPVASI
jgi:ABC-2 type transport system ATP-binding protein